MLQSLLEKLPHLLQNEKEFCNEMLRKAPFEVLGLTEEQMQEAYAFAYSLFSSKENKENCTPVFLLLSILHPDNDRYWLALGMSYQLEKNYEQAVDAYEMAALIALDHPVPFFCLGKCLYLLGDHTASALALELAIDYAKEMPEMENVLLEAQEAYNLVKDSR